MDVYALFLSCCQANILVKLETEKILTTSPKTLSDAGRVVELGVKPDHEPRRYAATENRRAPKLCMLLPIQVGFWVISSASAKDLLGPSEAPESLFCKDAPPQAPTSE